MKGRYVVDTNVLIGASAIDAASPIARDATPEDPLLRQQIWQWLSDFEQSTSRLVLDGQGQIEKEYAKKLGFNDFGRQVVIQKMSTCAVDHVDVAFDAHGDGILDEPLQTVVHDRADRKMVAAALKAMQAHGNCAIAFAGDTDWHDWGQALQTAGLRLEPVIEAWSRAKHREKSKTHD